MPKFTKQHYEIIAKLISDTRTEYALRQNCSEITTYMENKLSRIFIDDNPNFSLSRFEKACEIQDE